MLPNHEDEAPTMALAALGYTRRQKQLPIAERTDGSCACPPQATCKICIRDAAIRTAAFAAGAKWQERHPA